MLKNISLRHMIPLIFFSGSLLLVVFFYVIGLPAAQQKVAELSKSETHKLLLAQQSRIIELLVLNDPTRLKKEIFFTSSDPAVWRMLILDESQKILFSNRTRLVGLPLSSTEISAGGVMIPLQHAGVDNIVVAPHPGSTTLMNGFAALQFKRDEESFNLTLMIVRDFKPLSTAIGKIAALPSQILATVMLILSILAIFFLRRHLNNRLSPLLKGADQLAQGNIEARANLDGADEFSLIGRSFDQMADRIENDHLELIAAKENAEKSSLAKNRFLSLMSHEIQTPLAGLLGFFDLLKETKLDDDARLYVRSVESSARTLTGLIDDLLETSRLESGTIHPTYETFCLNSLLQDILDSVLPQSMHKSLSLKITSNENDPIWIESDPRLFRQILMKLLGNAVQFTEKGTITIAVTSKPIDLHHTALSIDVTDTGIGIAKDETGKVFERFFKSTDIRAQVNPGPGLGLATSRELAEILGGSIHISSSLNQGSTFTFNVEVANSTAPNDFNYAALSAREQKTLNILVVEQAEITQKLITSILGKWGHSTITCSRSTDAIGEMKARLIYPNKTPVNLIIIDLHMSGLNGIETMQEIRGLDSKFAHLPIIATSTQCDQATINRCLAAGFSGFVGKPLNRAQLADEIFRLSRLQPESSQ